MALHHIEPTQETVHGAFSRDFAPFLTIDPGDTVVFKTLDASWSLVPRSSPGDMASPERFFQLDQPRRGDGHCLCGPVAIRGAQPGMTLEVRIDEVRPGTWGWTAAGGFPHTVNERLGMMGEPETPFLLWTLDPAKMIGTNQFGHQVKLRPFMGVMGMPPSQPGIHSTIPPRPCGGNMDCKELTAGTTLYLPIEVEDALFSVGDGHAVQGDGEISVTAIECPMERVVLTFNLREDMPISTPHARTPEAWITLGLHEDLDEAVFRAVEAMLDLVQKEYGVERSVALGLASLVVDIRVTQMANGVLGAHAVLKHDALSGNNR